jgi:hypothetical protein
MSESSRTEKVAAIVAALSFAVSAAAFTYSVISNVETNDRLSSEKSEEFVQRVTLEEGPGYACAKHPECVRVATTQPQWVLINFNPIQLTKVWVEGQESKSVMMWNVQACSMYALPIGFLPVVAHVSDPHAQWNIPIEGAYSRKAYVFPTEDTGDVPWTDDVRNCP